MTMTFDFYATEPANAAKLHTALTAGDFKAVKRLAQAHADLSVTIGFDDLDTLSAAFLKSVRAKPTTILPKSSLTMYDKRVTSESGTEVVNPAWVKAIAAQSFTVGDLRNVFFAWKKALRKRYGNTYEAGPDHALALSA